MLKISEKILQITPPPIFYTISFSVVLKLKRGSNVEEFVHNLEKKATKEKRALTFQIYYHNPEIKYY